VLGGIVRVSGPTGVTSATPIVNLWQGGAATRFSITVRVICYRPLTEGSHKIEVESSGGLASIVEGFRVTDWLKWRINRVLISV